MLASISQSLDAQWLVPHTSQQVMVMAMHRGGLPCQESWTLSPWTLVLTAAAGHPSLLWLRINEGSSVGIGFGCESPEAEGIGGVADAGGLLFCGEGDTGSGVFTLEDQALAQDFVSLGIRRALEQGIDAEVRLGVSHRGMDPVAVFEQEEVSEEGGRVVTKTAFTVCSPDVFGVADGFLGAVVEVVAEARADLGFELDGEQELAVGDDEQVPLLFWPVVAGQLQGGAGADVIAGEPGADKNVGQQCFQRTHLGATRDGAAGACVDLPGFNLLLLLAFACVPERLYRLLEPLVEVC